MKRRASAFADEGVFGAPAPAQMLAIAYKNSGRTDEFDLIRESGLFDPRYYWKQLRDRQLLEVGVNPIEHYVERGEALGVAPNPLFDPHFYKETQADVAASGALALLHYVRHGDAEGRNPHPLFDVEFVRGQLGHDFAGNALAVYLGSRGPELQPHPKFDSAYVWERQQTIAPDDLRPCLVFFLEQKPHDLNPSREFSSRNYELLYPDIRPLNPFYHYMRYGVAEKRTITKAKYDLRGILDQVAEAALVEPDIIDIFAARTRVPWHDLFDMKRIEYKLTTRLSTKCGTRKFDHVMLAPWLKRGGAERVIVNLVSAILSNSTSETVLILCTQSDVVDASSWLPYSRRISVVPIPDVIDDSNPAYVAFCNWLQFFECKFLYVVNSYFGWELLSKYSLSLKPLVTTFGFVFCYDYDEFGRRAGYAWTHLRKALPGVDAFVSENVRAIDQFCGDHFLGAADRSKFHCLYQPVDSALKGRVDPQIGHNLKAAGERRHAVLWAARFDRQKGIDLALEIAAELPGIDFLFYGGLAEDLPDAPRALPDNAILKGVFDEFAALPLHEFSLFLHTSHWDGLPNVLLEAGAVGLPVLATDVGGVSELIDESTGWRVAHGAPAVAYREQIERILARPDETIARCRRLAARIDERHCIDTFVDRAKRLIEGVATARMSASGSGA